jgi:hypothetical protein
MPAVHQWALRQCVDQLLRDNPFYIGSRPPVTRPSRDPIVPGRVRKWVGKPKLRKT